MSAVSRERTHARSPLNLPAFKPIAPPLLPLPWQSLQPKVDKRDLIERFFPCIFSGIDDAVADPPMYADCRLVLIPGLPQRGAARARAGAPGGSCALRVSVGCSTCPVEIS